ncbi:hypothetical protein [Wolbachia endosymbiont (group E) of Neria commutata]|uniref:hypothetical protein n=1 Tax=Wolbachia endosymbiont (group E) of Neria commutata TaxID=3066149 RepID=UPI0031334D1E
MENNAPSNKCEDMQFENDAFVSKFKEENNNYMVKFTERFFYFTGCKKALELFPRSVISELSVVQNTELSYNIK